MSLSKVKSIQSNGSFDGQYGMMYKFEYQFEDGTILTANHKTDKSPFKEGDEVDYNVTKTHPEYGKSGTVKKPESAQYSGSSALKGGVGEDLRQLMIVRQSSLNRAVEILIHNANQSAPVDEIEAIELAERFTKWVMGKKEEAKPEAVKTAVKNSDIGKEPVIEEESDDLPF